MPCYCPQVESWIVVFSVVTEGPMSELWYVTGTGTGADSNGMIEQRDDRRKLLSETRQLGNVSLT